MKNGKLKYHTTEDGKPCDGAYQDVPYDERLKWRRRNQPDTAPAPTQLALSWDEIRDQTTTDRPAAATTDVGPTPTLGGLPVVTVDEAAIPPRTLAIVGDSGLFAPANLEGAQKIAMPDSWVELGHVDGAAVDVAPAEVSADCTLCGGSGVRPDAKPVYHPGAPGIADPYGWEPCECVFSAADAAARKAADTPPFRHPDPDPEWEAAAEPTSITDEDAAGPFKQPGKREKRERIPLTGDALRLATHVKEVFWQATASAPRTQQRTIGPSEIGHQCDRRIAYKLAGHADVNHRRDGWSAWVGTQIHQGLEEIFRDADRGRGRYLINYGVEIAPPTVPHGTLDRADRVFGMVIDDKAMGKSTLGQCWLNGAPSEQYRVQLHTYAYGMEHARGERFAQVALIAWPRESGDLDDLWTWVEDYDPSVAVAALARVQRIAELLTTQPPGAVTATPSYLCTMCPFYMPGSADLQRGCPGKEAK